MLKEFVAKNPKLVTVRESITHPGLFVVKYKRNVFYDNLWNDYLIECRGLVVDSNFNAVVRPFTKIFNRFENDTDLGSDEMVLWVQKINGFMAAATYVPSLDEVVVSTTGSLDSDFVKMAEDYITEDIKGLIKFMSFEEPFTVLFEIVHPNDPHIIKEKPGAYLIGARAVSHEDPYSSYEEMEKRLDEWAKVMGVYRPMWGMGFFSDVVDEVKKAKDEGVVVYSIDRPGLSLKIKSPFYLVSKFLGRVRDEKLELMLDDASRFKQMIKDEEFFPLVDFLIEAKDEFLALDEQGRIAFVQGFIEDTLYV